MGKKVPTMVVYYGCNCVDTTVSLQSLYGHSNMALCYCSNSTILYYAVGMQYLHYAVHVCV